jgi:hypothetical protein
MPASCRVCCNLHTAISKLISNSLFGGFIMLCQCESCMCMQGVEPGSLTFMQAQDGNLHVVVYPSQMSSDNTYPVYQRAVKPQPLIFVSAQASMQHTG